MMFQAISKHSTCHLTSLHLAATHLDSQNVSGADPMTNNEFVTHMLTLSQPKLFSEQSKVVENILVLFSSIYKAVLTPVIFLDQFTMFDFLDSSAASTDDQNVSSNIRNLRHISESGVYCKQLCQTGVLSDSNAIFSAYLLACMCKHQRVVILRWSLLFFVSHSCYGRLTLPLRFFVFRQSFQIV